jgi:hypothetical protein
VLISVPVACRLTATATSVVVANIARLPSIRSVTMPDSPPLQTVMGEI